MASKVFSIFPKAIQKIIKSLSGKSSLDYGEVILLILQEVA